MAQAHDEPILPLPPNGKPNPAADALVSRLIKLDRIAKRAEDRADKLKSLRAATERELLEEWQNLGRRRVTQGGKTAYLRRDVYVGLQEGIDGVIVAEALSTDSDTDWLVKPGYSSSALSGWWREKEKAGEKELPDRLKNFLKINEKYSIRIIAG